MAVEDVLARISQIESLAARFAGQAGGAPTTDFAQTLSRASLAPGTVRSAQTPATVTVGAAPPAGQGGPRAVALAAGEIGVAEEPSGSNDGARISDYRAADGSHAGMPWCATFVSWAAKSVGAPIGDNGQGYASVADIEAWGRRTGRFVPVTSEPRPGDIVLYGSRHVGFVESVGPGDHITTVEGNHGDRVARVDRRRSEITGYVRL
ncbi:MAG: CHAP domain-containing protein [Gaiellales bacterium]